MSTLSYGLAHSQVAVHERGGLARWHIFGDLPWTSLCGIILMAEPFHSVVDAVPFLTCRNCGHIQEREC